MKSVVLNTQKKLTLKEVARQLGVSTATISNAFNRPDQLSEALRARILSEAAALGYHGPSHAARSLRRGESDVIGVVLADSLSYNFSDPMANQLLKGIADVLVENKKQMLLLSSRGEAASQRAAESLPDGFIFYGAPDTSCFERIVRLGKPVVAVDFEQEAVRSVNIDNYQAAYTSAESVLKSTDGNICILGMRIIESDRVCRLTSQDILCSSQEISRQRLKGYLDAAANQNRNVSPDRIWHIPVNTPEKAEQAAREALTMTPRPRVLLCMSDVIALAALRVATQLDIRVPESLSVLGFDDIPAASQMQPALTTVCQQSAEKGRVAARMLFDESTDSVVLPTRFIQRASAQV
ncbi:LacI family DNA-binding transcriptional regulator [Aestuariibacter sp. AA17]|uniref:LacI family DNA-binding transcriptional regulator n=1 Tax=Fluctibacter corallii TaxID=2984329 RepID=A0ABT3ACA5_9ALTE|nr:LacI family DNA-binding transcriptional regulator [Aestuariibacter sp. AA17]MCV2886305.1 LacI family DNA-binding transcriptional regulator [Aestuariibacter sp. AA17]